MAEKVNFFDYSSFQIRICYNSFRPLVAIIKSQYFFRIYIRCIEIKMVWICRDCAYGFWLHSLLVRILPRCIICNNGKHRILAIAIAIALTTLLTLLPRLRVIWRARSMRLFFTVFIHLIIILIQKHLILFAINCKLWYFLHIVGRNIEILLSFLFIQQHQL